MSVSRVTSSLAVALAVALAACAPAMPRAAQTPSPAGGGQDGYRLQVTRQSLVTRLAQLQRGDSLAVEPEAREQGRVEAAYIRARLEQGDFRAGDRILLAVEGPQPLTPDHGAPLVRTMEQQLSDTFTVGPGQELTLPVIGVLSLRGVLRTELEAHLTQQISHNIRDPVLHARPLVRLSIVGDVARPGFYSVPADAPIPAVLMAAGGLAPDAKLNKMQINRSGQRLWEGAQLQAAMSDGRTPDDLGLRQGDEIVVPRRGMIDTYDALRFASLLLGIPLTIYALTKL